MDREVYRRMAAVEDRHWWFASRRAIVSALLARLKLPPDAEILEPGCGTGGNLAMLARWGRVYASEPNDEARALARRRDCRCELEPGRLPDRVPFGNRLFDLVVMTDVLEHLDDEAASLSALRSRLKPSGILVLTVPAVRWLWSGHDVSHHHRRRYGAAELRALIERAGYEVAFLSYCNFLLFPAIAAVRLMQRAAGKRCKAQDDLDMPSAWVNSILFGLFSSERHLLGRISLPIGVSIVAVARKVEGDGARAGK